MAESMEAACPSQVYKSKGYTDERFARTIRQLWDMEISPQDFQQLKPELVQKIYCAFIKDLGGNLERFNEIPPCLLSSIHSPEDYLGAVRLSVLSSNMQKYLKLIFKDDSFRLADVFNPKPKRSRKFFAMIYKFLDFTEYYFEDLGKKEDEVVAIIDRRDKMRARLEKVQQLINERKADNTRSEVSKEEEIRRLNEKSEELQKCENEKVVLKGQLETLSLSLASLSTAIKDTELRIMEAKEENQKLEGLVIQPSEEEEIRERNEKMAVLKEDNQRKKDDLSDFQQKIKSVTSLKEKIDKFISLLKENEEEKTKEKNLQASIEEKTCEISQIHENIKNQEEQNLQLVQRMKSTETKLQNMQQTWELKQKSLDMEIREQKEVLEGIQQNQTEQDRACKDMIDTIADYEEQIKQSKDSIRNLNVTIKSDFKFVLDVVEKENTELQRNLADAINKSQEFKK